MKSKITKRDILFFFIGVMALFFIDVAWNWGSHVKAFEEGLNDGYNSFGASEKQEQK